MEDRNGKVDLDLLFDVISHLVLATNPHWVSRYGHMSQMAVVDMKSTATRRPSPLGCGAPFDRRRLKDIFDDRCDSVYMLTREGSPFEDERWAEC